jgi:DNA-directed RNA polymerase specialized sigma24 family protein
MALSGEIKAGEDIVHDVLVDAARRAPRLRDRDRFRSWLYGAARRRGLFRSRARGVFWDWSGQADEEADPVTGLLYGELRQILEGSLDRLSLGDQDLLLLALRHCFEGPDLAAVLGTSPYRAAARVAKARARAEKALAAQLQSLHLNCADDQHLATCPSCELRSKVSVTALMAVPPALMPGSALRRRILHTASDPELAGYRADIVSRGGNLTPEGLPKQPDVASPLSRRYLVAGSAMAAAFVVAMIAALAIGPDLGLPTLVWPGHPPNDSLPPTQSSTTFPSERAKQEGSVKAGGPNQAPGQGHPTATGLETVPSAQDTIPAPSGPATPASSGPTPSSTISAVSTPTLDSVPIKLNLLVTTVVIGASHTAEIGMSAEGGTVHWSAVSSAAELVLGADAGTIPEGGVYSLVLTFHRALIQTPGSGQVTIINQDTGEQQVVKVSWPLSLL